MTKEFSRRKFLKLFLLSMMGLKCAATGNLKNELKTDLFKLDNLEKDFSRKKVDVDVYIDNEILLDYYKNDISGMMYYVKDFYDKVNVGLDINIVSELNKSLLKPAEHIGIEMLPFDKFYWKNVRRGEYPNNVMLSLGFAYINESIISIRDCEYIDDETKIQTIIHELEHMFGLFHPHKFKNNLGENDDKDLSYSQKSIIHSYLGKGEIYQQLKNINFDFDKYTELMRKSMITNNHNNY